MFGNVDVTTPSLTETEVLTLWREGGATFTCHQLSIAISSKGGRSERVSIFSDAAPPVL